MRDFTKIIKNWEDAAELGRFYRLGGDENRFNLGDLALFVCERKDGRPLAGTEDRTITTFSKEVGELRPVISQLMAMAEFLPDDDERQKCYDLGVGWHLQNKARIATGWKPGEAVTEKQRALFWDRVGKEADGGAPPERTPADDMRRTLAEITRLHDRMGEIGKRVGLPNGTYFALEQAQEALQGGLEALEGILATAESARPDGELDAVFDGLRYSHQYGEKAAE